MIRPVDAEVNQHYGENPTNTIRPGSPDYWIIERFGNYQPDGHAGEDYAVEEGAPIRAVTSGTVMHVGYYGGSYIDNPYWIAPNFAGYCYVIDHGAFIGIYAHGKNKAARVAPGQYVDEGQIIGLSGNTGGSTGPHLHFEILPDGFVVNSYMYGRTNPEPYFGGIAAQGTTTAQEDDMANVPQEEWEWAKQVLTALSDNAATKKDLGDIPNRVLTQPVPYKDPITGQDAGQTSLATMVGYSDFQATQTRLNTNAKTVAANIPDSIAQEVIDALAKRLSK